MYETREAGTLFLNFLQSAAGPDTRIHILSDSDADGLPAAAILHRALHQAGYAQTNSEVRRKFESAWSFAVRERLKALSPEILIVTDLGSRPETILPEVHTLLLDHHRPTGTPPGATLISSYREAHEGHDPHRMAPAGLLAYWCAQSLVPQHAGSLVWLAAVSLLSDLGDKAPFPELAEAKAVYGSAALRDLTALLNAPRRSVGGDASAALQLLLLADSPAQILTSQEPAMAQLRDQLLHAKSEVGAALHAARRLPPRFSSAVRDELGADLVGVRIHTPCQVHPLIAQQWRARFPRSVVFGINTGYRPGWVHFSGRAPRGINLIGFLQRHRPEGADEQYGNGHDQAAGGALPAPLWNEFIASLGFGPELLVEELREASLPQ